MVGCKLTDWIGLREAKSEPVGLIQVNGIRIENSDIEKPVTEVSSVGARGDQCNAGRKAVAMYL